MPRANDTSARTFWKCGVCGKSGQVEHDKHADLYSVINLLKSSHDELSPECEADISKMRVSKEKI